MEYHLGRGSNTWFVVLRALCAARCSKAYIAAIKAGTRSVDSGFLTWAWPHPSIVFSSLKNLLKAFHKFFKESKYYLRLGKSQSLDFDAQISDKTISLIQYNILSLAKRLLDYESLEELFKQAGVETLELTIAEKIWGYLLELLKLMADIFEIDIEKILDQIAGDNQSITKIIKMNAALNVA